jgi:Fe-S cluster assembly protein SufD
VNHTAQLAKPPTRASDPFAGIVQSRAAADPSWLRTVRLDALARFHEMGFPTTRDEEWRFTNLASLTRTEFTAAPENAPALMPRDLEPFIFPGLDTARVVFVNGRLSQHLSSLEQLPPGVRVLPLSEALSQLSTILRPTLEASAPPHTDAFTHLNAGMLEDGVFIHVPRGCVLEQPVHVLSVSVANGEVAIMTHPRNVIIVEANAQATIIEHYAAIHDSVYLTNAVTDVLAGDGACISHYYIEQESDAAFNIGTLRMRQGRSANVASHSVLLGGRLVRNHVNPVLAGEGGECLVNGLYVPRGTQHMDNHMRVEHASAHCGSRQFYKGILDDQSSAVFSGRIIVHPGAQKTDAKQTNRNLLLSDAATVDTKPQLEIYADDVKCTHGATIGMLDEQAIFYLRARGISNDAARSLLIHAFAGESLERMNLPQVRTYIDRLLLKRLPGGDFLEKLL